MKILIAVDSFKDCLSSLKVGKFLEQGILQSFPEAKIHKIPMADGGEGTVEALVSATNGQFISCEVHDPLMRKIQAQYGVAGDGITCIIEMASASGLELLSSEERNPWVTTSFGTGELILHALNSGFRRFILGIGGSATNDAGAGMAMALGAKFYDTDGNLIGFGGGELAKIIRCDFSSLDSRIQESEFLVACDVTNPLTGSNGASIVYGPQKGANAEMVIELDNALIHFSRVISDRMGINIETIPGAGAAGGLGGGMVVFLNARLQSGFEIVKHETNLESHCKWADIVITGEGRIDFQTNFGKTPQGVAYTARQYNKKVIAVAGTLGDNYQELYNKGFHLILSIVEKPCTIHEAISNAPQLLVNTGFTIGQILQINNFSK